MTFSTPDWHPDIDIDIERARVTIARRIRTLDAYAELCAMVLDDPDAADRYRAHVLARQSAA